MVYEGWRTGYEVGCAHQRRLCLYGTPIWPGGFLEEHEKQIMPFLNEIESKGLEPSKDAIFEMYWIGNVLDIHETLVMYRAPCVLNSI